MKKRLFLLCLLFTNLSFADENPALEAIKEYFSFTSYSEGSISNAQIKSINANNILFVDTRNPGQYATGHIPSAINIEWREVLERIDEIPSDKTVILYCETGLLSSKAHLALTIAGRDNVKVLWGGYLMWSSIQSFEDASK